jgi:hypothetical protein
MTAKLYANFKLEKSFKRRLLNALRSGKYKQAKQALYTKSDGESTGGFCCLGVMCVLKGFTKTALEGKGFPQDLSAFNEAFGVTPEIASFFDDCGGYSASWKVPFRGRLRPLNELNDLEELTFKQIANIIDRSVQTY